MTGMEGMGGGAPKQNLSEEMLDAQGPDGLRAVANDNARLDGDFTPEEAAFAEQETSKPILRLLSNEARRRFLALANCGNFEAFQNGVEALNALRSQQLNRTDDAIREELENEIAAERARMVVVVHFARGWELKAERTMQGPFKFEALWSNKK